MARFIKITVAILLALAAWVFLKAQIILTWKDLPRDAPFISRLLENTEYSESFTETGFSKVRPGMTKEPVYALVGQPLQIIKKSGIHIVSFLEYRNGLWHEESHTPEENMIIDSEIYYYSRQAHPTADWYVRAVTFSSEGVVTSIARTFYVD